MKTSLNQLAATWLADRDIEHAWTLVGLRAQSSWRVRRLRRCSGSPATVTANGAWTLAREEKHGDVAGFFHTHPHGPLAPSQRDLRTFRAWCDALGKPLLCVIATPRDIGAWIFMSRRSRGRRCVVQPAGATAILIEHEET
jgi:proteasome lid subunit RPN8/RPN11